MSDNNNKMYLLDRETIEDINKALATFKGLLEWDGTAPKAIEHVDKLINKLESKIKQYDT